MAKKAVLTIEDNETGGVLISCDFGDEFDQTSRAHQMIETLMQSVLYSAKSVEEIERTPAAEQPKIITKS